MEPGHLLHSALTCLPSGNSRHLKSRHPFVLAAQQLISTSDDTSRSAVLCADHRWNAESWRALQDSVLSSPPSWNGSAKNSNRLRSDVRHFPPVSTNGVMVSSAACECGTEDQTVEHCCLPMSNPSTSSWIARPGGSGRGDNRLLNTCPYM